MATDDVFLYSIHREVLFCIREAEIIKSWILEGYPEVPEDFNQKHLRTSTFTFKTLLSSGAGALC